MKKLTEEDIKYRYITPAIEESGWKKEQVFMEYFFTDGQVLVRGNTVGLATLFRTIFQRSDCLNSTGLL